MASRLKAKEGELTAITTEQVRLADKAAADAAAKAAAEQAARQDAQEVLQQLDGQLGAITGSLQQRVTQRVQGVDSSLSSAAGQISSTVSSVNQVVQQAFNDVEKQVSQLVSSVTGQINIEEVGRVVSTAQAQGKASVSRYTDSTNHLVAEASAFGDSQKQSVGQAVTKAANEIGARSNELTSQVQTTPTRITAQNAQQLLQQAADAAYGSLNTQADHAEAAVRSKAEEVTSALHLAQETAQASLREIPGSVQAGLARVANTYRFAGNAGTTLSIPGQGVVPLGEAVAALGQAIKEAIAALGRIAVAGPGAYIATFLTLGLYSSSTATEEQDRVPARFRYNLGVPPDQLGLPPDTDLRSIALAQGSVDLPFRLTNETHNDGRSYVSVVNTKGGSVSKSVPVRAVTLDPQTGLYTVSVPSLVADQPPITLTWTPASPPGKQPSTTTTPAVTPTVPTYAGVELKPVVIEAETYPGVLPDASDLIITFPADSGIDPVYVMFSEPLDSGVFTRKQLDKKYKHAKNFGITDSQKNGKTLAEFRDAIEAHLKDKETIEKGTYLYSEKSKVYFNPVTKNVVILDSSGRYLSGWKLVPGTPQYENYVNTGKLK